MGESLVFWGVALQALGTLHGNKTGRRHRGDPEKSGFGMHTIRDLITYEFGGTVDLAFPPGGAGATWNFPLTGLAMTASLAARDCRPVSGRA